MILQIASEKKIGLSTLFKNSALLFASRVMLKCLSFASVLLMTRYLGVAGYGLVSYALALSGLLSILLDLGVTQFSIREVAKEIEFRANILSAALWTRIITAFLALVACFAGILVTRPNGNSGLVIWILIAGMAVKSFGQVPYSAFAGMQRMGFIAVFDVVAMFALVAGVGVTILLDGGVFGIAISYCGSYATYVAICFIMMPQVTQFHPGLNARHMLELLKRSLPLALLALSVELYLRIDTIMLKLLVGDVAVGYYSSAYRLVETSLLFCGSYISAAFPFLSNCLTRDIRSFRRFATISFRVLLLGGVGVAIFLFTISPDILRFLYGEQFLPATQTLRILSWASAAMFLGALASTLMVIMDRQMLNCAFVVVTLVVDMLLDLLLIPTMLQRGAAIATLSAEVFYLALTLAYLLRRKALVLNLRRILPVTMFSIFVGLLFAKLSRMLGVPEALGAFVSVCAYALCAIPFGLERAERSAVRHLLGFS